MTFLIGALSYFVLPQSPLTAKFLTTEEKAAVRMMLEDDGTAHEEHEAFNWDQVKRALKSPFIWIVSDILC